MPTPSDSPVVSRPVTPGFEMDEDEHIIEIDVESVLFDVSLGLSLLSPFPQGGRHEHRKKLTGKCHSACADGWNLDQLVTCRRGRLEVVRRDLPARPRGYFGL
jgi:hypothetical protein